MELSEEVIKEIEKKCEDMALAESSSPSDWEYIAKYYRVGMKAILSDPELLSKAGYVKKEEVFQFLDNLRTYEQESGGKLCFDERTSEQLWDIHVGLIDADLNPLPSPPQNK